MKKIGILFALLLAISLLACSQVSSPSLSEPASSEEAAGNLQTVVFPAYTDEKTQYAGPFIKRAKAILRMASQAHGPGWVFMMPINNMSAR